MNHRLNFHLLPTVLLWVLMIYPFTAKKKEIHFSKPVYRSVLCGNSFGISLNLLDSLETPPLFPDMGSHHYPVHTIASNAQDYFDQGLKFLYAFNHNEAYRAFKAITKVDPYCAMAYWGIAMALGPNINDWIPSPEREQEAFEAIQNGIKIAQSGGKELDLIVALGERHADSTQVNRDSLNLLYMAAMQKLSVKYPSDLEIQTLYADAIMNTMPWDYYLEDGSPKKLTDTTVSVLEYVIDQNSNHPGAHHLYIHIVEASKNPDRGVPSADLLGTLIPAAGHIVHMPAHIYARVGRYEDAAQSNRLAIERDEDYLASVQTQGVYPSGYYPHNIHFLWMAATLSGQSNEAIDAAEKVADKIPSNAGAEDLGAQGFLSVPYMAYVRFAKWNDILTAPKPPQEHHIQMLYWRYARAIAFCKKDLLDKVQPELDSINALIDLELEHDLDSLLQEPEMDSTVDKSMLNTYNLLRLVPSAELATMHGNYDEAISLLKAAMVSEDALPYNEPPNWHHPVRLILGNLLLHLEKNMDAEQAFLEDLQKNRDNGWALMGLYQSQKRQQKEHEAAKTLVRFHDSWSHSDFELSGPVL